MSNSRLLELDALRGIAAISVVIYHYFYRYDKLYGNGGFSGHWSFYGKYGVNLFFIVSGFVIFWSLNRIEKPMDFIVYRLSRLYPIYWIAAILTFIIVKYFGLPGREISYQYALANSLMIQEYLHIPHIDGVYWTLTVELTFYFWIFIVYLFGQLKNIEYFFIPLIILSAVQSYSEFELPTSIKMIFILKYAPFFLIGICFWRLGNNIKAIKSLFISFFSLLSTIFIYSINEFIVFCFLYIIFFISIFGHLKFLKAKPLLFLGTISYTLYLFHQNIGYVIINIYKKNNSDVLTAIIISIIFSITIASMLSYFIEKPLLSKIRRWYKENLKVQKFANILRPFNFHNQRNLKNIKAN